MYNIIMNKKTLKDYLIKLSYDYDFTTSDRGNIFNIFFNNENSVNDNMLLNFTFAKEEETKNDLNLEDIYKPLFEKIKDLTLTNFKILDFNLIIDEKTDVNTKYFLCPVFLDFKEERDLNSIITIEEYNLLKEDLEKIVNTIIIEE